MFFYTYFHPILRRVLEVLAFKACLCWAWNPVCCWFIESESDSRRTSVMDLSGGCSYASAASYSHQHVGAPAFIRSGENPRSKPDLLWHDSAPSLQESVSLISISSRFRAHHFSLCCVGRNKRILVEPLMFPVSSSNNTAPNPCTLPFTELDRLNRLSDRRSTVINVSDTSLQTRKKEKQIIIDADVTFLKHVAVTEIACLNPGGNISVEVPCSQHKKMFQLSVSR